jgi:multidrug efflux system outer membrane protein
LCPDSRETALRVDSIGFLCQPVRLVQEAQEVEKGIVQDLRRPDSLAYALPAEDAMVAVRTYQIEYASRLRQLEAARSAEGLSWIRYDQGMTSYLEYLEVQRQLFSSELRASETLQLRLMSLVQLYKALGGGWNPVEEAAEIE